MNSDISAWAADYEIANKYMTKQIYTLFLSVQIEHVFWNISATWNRQYFRLELLYNDMQGL